MDLNGPIILAGALVGFAVGLTGMGGGALMTPLMVMLFGVNPTAAIGSDLAASVFMKPFGALVHQRAGTVRWCTRAPAAAERRTGRVRRCLPAAGARRR